VGVAGGKRVEWLRRDGVEQWIDRVGPCCLQTRISLKAEPSRVLSVDVVIGAGGLDLLMVVTGVGHPLAIRASVGRWELWREQGHHPN
jgi:hypothetical protein